MRSARMIKAQHPKNVRAIVQTIKGKPNSPKETKRMAWWVARWPIKPPKDLAPSNFSNVTKAQILNST